MTSIMEYFSICRLALWMALLSVVQCSSVGSSQSSRSTDTNPPNIIVVLHEMYWGDIGYNNEDVITPVMDELANTGAIFDRYYVKGHSSLSRSQLLTGKHATTLGLQTERVRPSRPFGLPLDTPTMGDRLKEEGYSTHFIGKWNLGNFKKEYTPTYRGFDTFYGLHSALRRHYDHDLPCPANLSDWGYDMWDNEGENLQPVRPQDMVGQYDTLLFRNRAVRNIDRHDRSKPLFMLVAPLDVGGSPDDVPQAYVDLYSDKSDEIELGLRLRFARSTIIDDLVKDIREALKFNQMWENTVLLVISDKAGTSGSLLTLQPLSFYLGNIFLMRASEYRESKVHGIGFLHSPLLDTSRQGVHIKDMIYVSDFFPTLLHAAGLTHVENEADMYGKDMWPVIRDGKPGSRTDVLHFMEHGRPLEGVPLYTDTFDTRIHACFTDGDFKLNTGFFTEWPKTYFLYNIADDPEDLTDLSGDSAHTDRIRSMLNKMQVYHLAAAPPLFFAPGNGPDPLSCPRHHGGYFAPWQ